jgi:hypothetical protein
LNKLVSQRQHQSWNDICKWLLTAPPTPAISTDISRQTCAIADDKEQKTLLNWAKGFCEAGLL